MNKFRPLLAITIILQLPLAGATQQSKFDLERLSPKGRAAYQKLSSAEIFRVGSVGYSGETSQEELALYDLLDEREAVGALKSLVSGGSYEGGLYGLLGLSITNAGEFKRAIEVYKSREQPPERGSRYWAAEGQVTTQSGCVIGAEDWLKVVSNIQSGHYDKVLRKERR